MAIQYQILCSVKKTIKDRKTIVQIGGRNPHGEVWSLKLDQAKAGLKNGEWEFFINHLGNSYPIQLIETEDGSEVLAAIANEQNLLLALPDCPN